MKPLILITNDDGIDSPGLLAAAEAVGDLGDLLIVAPNRQQTGMGRSFPRDADTGMIDEKELCVNGERRKGYGLHGSPALAVAHGVMELADRKPDLCISGINYGENIGTTITCSGTLGAAFEANSYGIPAIAVSLETDFSLLRSGDYVGLDWSVTKEILRKWVIQTLEQGMPDQVDVWNINVPAQADTAENCRITTQSRQGYFEFQRPEKRDYRKAFELPAQRLIKLDSLEVDSDIYAIYVDHVISITPLNLILSVPVEMH